MRIEPCIPNCKFNREGKCDLYSLPLRSSESIDCKCDECMEKEISCSIDNKIREIYSFYHSFVHEMDILFKDIDKLVDRRKSIYK